MPAEPAYQDHVEASEWVADDTGTDEPRGPHSLDVDAVTPAMIFPGIAE